MKLPVTLERDETGAVVAECAEQGLPVTVRTVEVDVAVA
jgi:hypothetical protein